MGCLRLTYQTSESPLKVVYRAVGESEKPGQRFISVDPLAKKYINQSPYNFCGNSPLLYRDPNGKEVVVTITQDANGDYTIILSAIIYMTGEGYTNEVQQELDKYFSADNKCSLFPDGSYTYLETASDGSINERNVKITFEIMLVPLDDPQEISKNPHLSGPAITEFLDRTDQELQNHGNNGDPSSELPDGYNIFNATLTEFRGVAYMEENWGIAGNKNASQLAVTIIHEIGHFLGFTDKYDDVKTKGVVTGSTPHTDESGECWNTDIMSTNELGKITFSKMHYRDICKYWIPQFKTEQLKQGSQDYNPGTRTMTTKSQAPIDETKTNETEGN